MINLKDKLSHLTYRQACKLLGSQGEKLIRQGGQYDIDLSEQVILQRDLFQLNLGEAVVMIRLDPAKNQKLNFQCNACTERGISVSLQQASSLKHPASLHYEQ